MSRTRTRTRICSAFNAYVAFILLGLFALVNAHPVALDSSLLGTIEPTSALQLLDAIKLSIPDVLAAPSLSSDPLSLATSLTATLIGGGIAMYLT